MNGKSMCEEGEKVRKWGSEKRLSYLSSGWEWL